MSRTNKLQIGLLLVFGLLTCFALLYTNTAGHRAAYAALHTLSAQKDIVNDSTYDPEALQAGLASSAPLLSTPALSLEAKDHTHNYKALSAGLVPGETYLLLVGGAARDAGQADFFSVRVFDFASSKVLLSRHFSLQPAHGQAWLFTVPENASADKVSLLVYAGIAGSTNHNAVTLKDITFYAWDEIQRAGVDFSVKGGK